jgi:hypothetical protein
MKTVEKDEIRAKFEDSRQMAIKMLENLTEIHLYFENKGMELTSDEKKVLGAMYLEQAALANKLAIFRSKLV